MIYRVKADKPDRVTVVSERTGPGGFSARLLRVVRLRPDGTPARPYWTIAHETPRGPVRVRFTTLWDAKRWWHMG